MEISDDNENNILEQFAGLTADQRETVVAKIAPKRLSLPNVNARGAPVATRRNYDAVFQHYNISIRYNEMTKELEIDIPGHCFHQDTELNAKIAQIRDFCIRHELPVKELDGFIDLTANQNSYHPVRDWLNPIVWDGQDRLGEWFNTVELSEPNPLKEVMMSKWALSCVAALYHPNFSCEGVLTYQSAQGRGKTISIENILPREHHNRWNKDAVVLDVKNKDTQFKALAYWIAELGEIDATFRKSDIEALKGFLTEKVDVLRPAYARKANKYPRRTVFYASVNEREFLQDSENRRFWVLAVERFHHADIDVAQFWAQMREWYLAVRDRIGSATDRERHQEWGWFLNPREREQLQTVQLDFRSRHPIEEILDDRIDLTDPVGGEPMNCTQILMRLGYTARLTKGDLNIAGKWLRDHGYRAGPGRRYTVVLKTADTPWDRVVDQELDDHQKQQLQDKIKQNRRNRD